MMRIAASGSEFRFYVYAWQYPDGRTFYVGKGVKDRDIREKSHNPIFTRILAKIRRDGGEPRIVRWHEGLREDDAHQLEKAYINLFGRRNIRTGVLANLTDGGEGTSGHVTSNEARAKLSAAKKGNTFNLGRSCSAETREKISAAQRGITKTPETRAKMSETRRGRAQDALHLIKLGEARRSSQKCIDHRAKLIEAKRCSPPKEGFKGVHFNKVANKWVARIKVDGDDHYIGTFSDPEDAARAYDNAVLRFLGPGPWYLNFGRAL